MLPCSNTTAHGTATIVLHIALPLRAQNDNGIIMYPPFQIQLMRKKNTDKHLYRNTKLVDVSGVGIWRADREENFHAVLLKFWVWSPLLEKRLTASMLSWLVVPTFQASQYHNKNKGLRSWNMSNYIEKKWIGGVEFWFAAIVVSEMEFNRILVLKTQNLSLRLPAYFFAPTLLHFKGWLSPPIFNVFGKSPKWGAGPTPTVGVGNVHR